MKWFLAVFLVCLARNSVGEPESPSVLDKDVQCLAGTEWESYCNQCQCLENGIAKCQKQESCASDSIGEPITCKPNTMFKRGCEVCRCLVDGQVSCDSNCQEEKPTDVILKPTRVQSTDNNKYCAPGTKWTTPCNECVCSEEGKPVCTEGTCTDKNNGGLYRCAPESKWMNSCNHCYCTSNGVALCTLMGCIEDALGSDFNIKENEEQKTADTELNKSKLRITRAATQEAPKACQPGQEFRLDCNKCLCDNEGTNFSCTRIDCNGLNTINGGTRSKRDTTEVISTNCTAGSVFNEDCNVCRCDAQGQKATCTTHSCSKHDNDINSPVADPNFRCNPGEQFKRDCNDCTCTADGKSVFCTLRMCQVYKP